MPAVVQAAKRASVPVAIHMDHCSSLASVQAAVRLGANGVMYDSSHAELPVNIEQTKKAVELAHSCGVPVEGELLALNSTIAIMISRCKPRQTKPKSMSSVQAWIFWQYRLVPCMVRAIASNVSTTIGLHASMKV